MNKLVTIILFSFFLTFSLFAETITGKVVRVSDGDTFTILNPNKEQVRVRLYGIDAPETKGGQPYSQKSRQKLSEMIAGKTVSVVVKDYDRYGRALGIVSTEHHKDVNLEMIRSGMAWHYDYYDNTPAYVQAHKKAKENKIGLWADKNPINPYEWRKGIR